MSTAHTPGPWATRPIYGSLPDQSHALFWQDGQRSRRLDDGGVFKAGDAALIAAAPDLLAVCVALVRADQGMGDNLTLATMQDMARAAIARAEGRS